jgi:hypothetical protein
MTPDEYARMLVQFKHMNGDDGPEAWAIHVRGQVIAERDDGDAAFRCFDYVRKSIAEIVKLAIEDTRRETLEGCVRRLREMKEDT